MSAAERLYTTREVSELLGFSVRSIQRWATDGRIQAKFYRVCGSKPALRFTESAVDAFVARHVRERDEAPGDD